MKTKRMFTANLVPGMVVAEPAYTYDNHLVIQSNTELTEDIIDKLKYYSIKTVRIYVNEPSKDMPKETKIGPTYFERIEQSDDFKKFQTEFNSCIKGFRQTLNDMIIKSSDGLVDEMLSEIESILEKSRNPLHLLEMMQCMRGYDDLTYTHSMNVALISNVIGTWLNLGNDDLETLMIAGMLHDIGKLRIPPEIIQKPAKLTDSEYEIIKNHPQYGYDILSTKNLNPKIKMVALQHHERYDGKGYPYGLKSKEIDLFSGIVAIADVYDAMTADRVYRKGICPFPVLEHMELQKELYEPGALYKFIERTVEAYINTEVRLSNGDIGRVVLLNKNFLSRPIVISGDKTYDLSKDFHLQIEALL
ncbi:HD-GYP domain-containing protein [Butyribacter sp.]|uniref:HD-GYP domain-containing protein n=1 Tax=Butyribacter sp. TaxID=2822465 RepID=UPI002A9D5F89|nr:HD-GYP domain-containing protein [Butyribacter sp.]